MYGKLFASLFQGTMRGQADAILVFTNLLAHADAAGNVDKHWRAISEETGIPIDRVKEATAFLEAPDPESRTPDFEGRRIIPLDEHRAWGWFIVNYEKYRKMRNEDERREQNRLAQERWRDKQRNQSKQPSAKPNRSSAQSAQEEGEEEGDKEESIGGAENSNWGWPVQELIDAFPDYLPDRLQPGQLGQIEATVCRGDEKPWTETIEKYKLNFNPMTKTYMPDKVGNLLSVFRDLKARNSKQETNGTRKSERDKSADRTINTINAAEQLRAAATAAQARARALPSGPDGGGESGHQPQ